MSVICWLLGLSPSQISALRTEPSLAGGLARGAQDLGIKKRLDEVVSWMPREKGEAARRRQAVFAQIAGAKEAEKRNARDRARFEELGPLEDALSLEKSWHMLHYLFTGHVDPWDASGNALATGEALGEDLGYGPVRLHGETGTLDFARFLEAADLARLRARVRYREMSRLGIYGMPMGRGSEAEFEAMLRMEVACYFPLLRDYAVRMAGKRYGLLTWLSYEGAPVEAARTAKELGGKQEQAPRRRYARM